ncbi:MAG: hypothetical protein IKO41_06065 [Lachnospiraceae bacterium]|nr:hypothetical protein [Lachnospiraceae bacterium]
MSKINAIRFINVNYNNDTIRINDEYLYFKGASTLISLENGGGKSVMIQMLMAPFVAKSYRDLADRKFSGYFHTAQPSFILVEWLLDGGSYLLTGMMVRRNQHVDENNEDELEILNFMSEYSGQCDHDIYHLPVVEKSRGRTQLKSFAECRALFEAYKKEKGQKFFLYDMNGSQSSSYFAKLREYGINSKEWQTIIRTVNKEEGGLSKIFSECKDERRLIEKWLLPQIETKLNREQSLVSQLQDSFEQYVRHYHEMEASIEQKGAIVQFQQDATAILEMTGVLKKAEDQRDEALYSVRQALLAIEGLFPCLSERRERIDQRLAEINAQIAYVTYAQLSVGYYARLADYEALSDRLEAQKGLLERIGVALSAQVNIQQIRTCQVLKHALDNERAEISKLEKQAEMAHSKAKDFNDELFRLGAQIKRFCLDAMDRAKVREASAKEAEEEARRELAANASQREALESTLLTMNKRLGELSSLCQNYERLEDSYFAGYGVVFETSLFQTKYAFPLEMFERHAAELAQKHEKLESSRNRKEGEALNLRKEAALLERSLEDSQEQVKQTEIALNMHQRELEELERELDERRAIAKYLDLDEGAIFDTPKLEARSRLRISEHETEIARIDSSLRELATRKERYEKGFLSLSGKLLEFFRRHEIPVVYGMEWLRRHPLPLSKKLELLERNRFLPYALLLEPGDFTRLAESQDKVECYAPIPLINREYLTEDAAQPTESQTAGLAFYTHIDREIFDEEKCQARLADLAREMQKLMDLKEERMQELAGYRDRLTRLCGHKVSHESYTNCQKTLDHDRALLARLKAGQAESRQRLQKMRQDEASCQEELTKLLLAKSRLAQQISDFSELTRQYERYREEKKEAEHCTRECQSCQKQQAELAEAQSRLQQSVQLAQENRKIAESEQQRLHNELDVTFGKYEDTEALSEDFDIVTAKGAYSAIVRTMETETQINITAIEEDLKRHRASMESWAGELKNTRDGAGITDEEIAQSQISESELAVCKQEQARLQKKRVEENAVLMDLTGKCSAAQAQMEHILAEISQTCGQSQAMERERLEQEGFLHKDFAYQQAELAKARENAQAELDVTRKEEEGLHAIVANNEAEFGSTGEMPDNLPPLPDYFSLDAISIPKMTLFIKGKKEDYSQALATCHRERSALSQLVTTTLSQPVFDPIRKILPDLLSLMHSSATLLRELPLKLSILESMAGKLEKDISKIDEEKDVLTDLFYDYLERVNVQMNLIDNNSSIRIRDKSRKTLQIKVPSWDENRDVYRHKIRDLMDTVRTLCLEELHQGKPVHDLVASRLTTRELYDKIVGIGNIAIELIKVEAQREIVIPWKSVTTNSGGEGFLSSFIVLSSLLSYMRHDEGNSFRAAMSEGKTLIMDNPFGKTNASHLLKPLMEMAKKNNLQLICLTGLGGDSIYDRFDNIYVLNLIPAAESGVTFVRSSKEKGDNPAVLSLARLQVADENSLISLFTEDIDLDTSGNALAKI